MSTTTQNIFYSYNGPKGIEPSKDILEQYKDKGLIFDEKNRIIYANALPYGNVDIEWTTLSDSEYNNSGTSIKIGEHKFDITDKELLQVDANGVHIVEELINKNVTLNFVNGKAITGYEDNRFKHISFVDDTILNGALVITKDGLFIHDGSNYELFEGVVLSIPGYNDVNLNGELELSKQNRKIYTNYGVLDKLDIDTSTVEGRALQTIIDNYDGYLMWVPAAYWWICSNFSAVCEEVEQKTGKSLGIDYYTYTLSAPIIYVDDLVIDVPSDIQETWDMYMDMIRLIEGPQRKISLNNINNNLGYIYDSDNFSDEDFDYIEVCDLSYNNFNELFNPIWGQETINKIGMNFFYFIAYTIYGYYNPTIMKFTNEVEGKTYCFNGIGVTSRDEKMGPAANFYVEDENLINILDKYFLISNETLDMFIEEAQDSTGGTPFDDMEIVKYIVEDDVIKLTGNINSKPSYEELKQIKTNKPLLNFDKHSMMNSICINCKDSNINDINNIEDITLIYLTKDVTGSKYDNRNVIVQINDVWDTINLFGEEFYQDNGLTNGDNISIVLLDNEHYQNRMTEFLYSQMG